MTKHSLLIARFPYHGTEHHTVTDWLMKTYLEVKSDPRIGDVHMVKIDDTPITMSRNRACALAKKLQADLVLMIDSDMAPDNIKGGKPFWKTSLDFLLTQHVPCVIGAPYCGPPPHENVYIFKWANFANDGPDPEFTLAQYTREEAAQKTGIEEVAALPTGLVLFHTHVLDGLGPNYFQYEWTDEYATDKASTEDVFWTRNLSLSGVPQYCNWDAWAGHWKQKCVSKPVPLGPAQVGSYLKQALQNGRANCKLVDVPEGGLELEGASPHAIFKGRRENILHKIGG